MAAIAQEAIWFAFREGGIRKQGGGHWLQGQGYPHFFNHVGFRAEIQIDLNRAGPAHHIQAQIALFGHIGFHDFIAALGHPMNIIALPQGIKAQADRSRADFLTGGDNLIQMAMDFRTGLVDVFQGRAR